MTTRTFTLTASNSAGSVSANASVTVADPPGSGNTVELVGVNVMADVNPDPARVAVYRGYMGQGGMLADSGMAYAPPSIYGENGAFIIYGGGHADSAENTVYVFKCRQTIWTRLTEPSTAMPELLWWQQNGKPAPALWPQPADMVHGEYADGTPMASHTFSNLTVIPGGNKGLLLSWGKLACEWSGFWNVPWSHACDLETGVWSRYSLNACPGTPAWSGNMPADVVCYDEQRNRTWAIRRGNSNSLSYLDHATRMHSAPFAYLDAGSIPTAPRIPVHDLLVYICCPYSSAGVNKPFRMGAVNLGNPSADGVFLNLVGDIPSDTYWAAYGFDWDQVNDCGYIYRGNWGVSGDIGTDTNIVWRIDPPAANLLTSPWTLTKITLPTALPRQLNGVYSRWKRCDDGKFALMSNIGNKIALWTPPS